MGVWTGIWTGAVEWTMGYLCTVEAPLQTEFLCPLNIVSHFHVQKSSVIKNTKYRLKYNGVRP